VKSQKISACVLDMDGVLYLDDTPRPGAVELLACLRKRQVPYVYLTNNASRSAAQYVARLNALGLDREASEAQIITSAQVAVAWLHENLPREVRVLLVGEPSFRNLLLREGFALTEVPDADVVVVGFDTALTYDKLAMAALAIRRGARFIGTNPDTTYPTPEGLLPGTGSILAAIEAATGVQPTVMGKPHRPPFEEALRRLAQPAGQTIMIGDRLETDIAGGQGAGMITGFVLGGVSSEADLAQNPIQPDYVFKNVEHLAEWCEEIF